MLKRRSKDSKNELLYAKAHAIIVKLTPVDLLLDIALLHMLANGAAELVSQAAMSQLDCWMSYLTSDAVLGLIVAYKVLHYK